MGSLVDWMVVMLRPCAGYWIPDCQKMRYKSEYSPSYLLDPVSSSFLESLVLPLLSC
jgi:hypothetical protein